MTRVRPRTNGHVPAALADGFGAGFRRPVRTGVLKLTGDYAGVEVTVRINPPLSIFDSFATKPREALGKLIIAWTLADENGNPVVLDSSLSGATDEELAEIAKGYAAYMSDQAKLPKPDETISGIGSRTNT